VTKSGSYDGRSFAEFETRWCRARPCRPILSLSLVLLHSDLQPSQVLLHGENCSHRHASLDLVLGLFNFHHSFHKCFYTVKLAPTGTSHCPRTWTLGFPPVRSYRSVRQACGPAFFFWASPAQILHHCFSLKAASPISLVLPLASVVQVSLTSGRCFPSHALPFIGAFYCENPIRSFTLCPLQRLSDFTHLAVAPS